MRRLLMFMLLAVGMLSAIAQDAPNALSRADASIVLPAQAFRMFPQDWDAFQGTYFLSNGQTMVLRRSGLRMIARVAGAPPQPLVAATANEFIAVDRRLKVTLVDEGQGRIAGQVVMVLPRQAAQQSNAKQGEVVRLAIR